MSGATVLPRLELSEAPAQSKGVTRAGVTVELQLAEGTAGDAYLVTAIDAGTGNGWEFPPSVLSTSVSRGQWGRVNVYLGHAGSGRRGPNGERQPEDLAGVFSGEYLDFSTDLTYIWAALRKVR